MQEILQSIFDISSIWSVVARGVLWLMLTLVVILSMDGPSPEKSVKNLKSNLGFFLLFVALSSTLVYLLFGYQPS